MTSSNDKAPSQKGVCPTCAKPTVADYAPFCSKRCADIDLHRWLVGAYAVPAVETDDAPTDAGDAGDAGGDSE
ncbi:MAG: DNA gyrase inhibitor YacG [Parvularculaceae bacterium]